MKVLLTIINLIFLSNLFGQTKTLHNIKNSDGDTSFFYKYQLTVINGLSLTRLDTSPTPFYFRIWTTNQALEVWKNNENNYTGIVTSWVTESPPHKEKPTKRILIDKQRLNPDTVKLIFNLIESSQILKLPSDDSIKGWSPGFDGVNYITEYSTAADYFFKTYWTPKSQDTNLTEAKFFQSFADNIFEISNSIILWQNFQKTIPYECYNVGGTCICKVVTKKQKKEFARERKTYRRQADRQTSNHK